MKERLLEKIHTVEGKTVTCQVCQKECRLIEGQSGYCSGYVNKDGQFTDLTYGRITTAQVTKLGWAPVKMFAQPETKILSVGSRGCNFYCSHCINKDHSSARHDREISPEQMVKPEVLVEYAQALDCKGIAANFNEALLAVPYWRDVFKLAKQEGLLTVAVTNGYNTPQALDLIGPYLDVYRCDIKAVSPQAMSAQAVGISPKGVLDSLKYVKTKFPRLHIEAVTMIVPGVNDSEEELGGIASWIRENLGSRTAWHISPFEPSPKRSLNGPPAYLTGEDLLNGDRVKGSSVVFGPEGNVGLRVGDMGLDSGLAQEHSELERAVLIGRECGLENVFAKTDGH